MAAVTEGVSAKAETVREGNRGDVSEFPPPEQAFERGSKCYVGKMRIQLMRCCLDAGLTRSLESWPCNTAVIDSGLCCLM